MAFAVLAGMLALALYPGQSSAAFRRVAAGPVKVDAPARTAPVAPAAPAASVTSGASLAAAAMFQLPPAAPSIATYDCDTDQPKTTFILGEAVCAKATGAPSSLFPWRVSWISPSGLIEQFATASSDPSTEYQYTLPTADTSLLGGFLLTRNRGTWRVYLTRANGSIRASASFTVRAPDRAVADVFARKFVRGSDNSVAPGGVIAFVVIVANGGPDAAQGVHLTEVAPAGATLSSFSQDSGPSCAPADSPDCTITSLANGERAEFTAIYQIAGGASLGTVETTASVSSTTTELDEDDNTAAARFEVAAGGGEAECLLECPNDITVSANTTQGDQSGAIVTFGGAEPFGSCGALSTSQASGSFFPVGTTTVTSTAAGGASCSFTVTVVEGGGPTISCPANITTTSDDCTATIATGTPTASAGATVTGERSDGQPLDTSFGAGTTSIVWTATDSVGRTASCTQTITVNVNDTTAPTINAPDDLTLTTGAGGATCGVVVSEAALGRAEAEDGGCTVNITRTGVPAGNFFPVGTTTITWTATDAGGNTATDTQTVTVTENSPPAIRAPADAQYTCLSEVPAADPSQATGTNDNLPDGGPVVDNCGVTPTVTVSEAPRTGSGSAADPYLIKRTFTASDGVNSASSVQTITVIDPTPPTVALVGGGSMTHECHTSFADPGVTTGDNCNDAPVTVTTSGGFNPDVPGTYTITYTAKDGAGNTATAQRTVTVVDTIKPVITLSGASSMTVECHTSFADPGATAADSCDAGVPVTASGSVDVNTPGVYTINYNASDDSGNAAIQVTRTVTVVDTTRPVITLNGAGTMTVECHTSFADPGATAADSCDTSVPVTASGSVDVNVPGTYTISYAAADDSGNAATTVTRTVTVVDTTAPVISCPANIVVTLPANSTATSTTVNFSAPTATDSCDASVPVVTDKASGSVFNVGTTTVTSTATDDSGNTSSCSFTVTVLYNFTGFFSPVGNLPVLNSVNAGRAVPLKFNLSGNKGLSIFAAGFPASQQVACSTSAPVSDLEGIVTSGGSTLTYDAGSDQYHYNWKTENSWAGTCRLLVVKLNDGSEHKAQFKFK
ncbi:MAG: DUF5011 domain-containing protein [Acidobacteria bacterium]|nr:DUF5011 domain-containing protein [Acidobacteriota bacterium]